MSSIQAQPTLSRFTKALEAIKDADLAAYKYLVGINNSAEIVAKAGSGWA